MTCYIREPGALGRLGDEARALGGCRVLLVADKGVIDAGHAPHARARLDGEVSVFSAFGSNPTTADAERGRAQAAEFQPDLIVGLGGGSSLDCAKAINFLLTNGGSMQEYWGYDKAEKPLLPMILVPTTTGTGSEAQSYCVISDATTHRKMACGAPSAMCKLALLDAELALSQPRPVRAAAGYDALIHAVETWVTTKRTRESARLSREAWQLLSSNYELVLEDMHDFEAIDAMQWGAYCAGAAIERSMLGATHACANPLSQYFGTPHGHALAILAPHVVEFNADPRYAELDPALAQRLREWARLAGLPSTLREVGVTETDLTRLAASAAEQWTGQYNPRPFGQAAALEIYRCAF